MATQSDRSAANAAANDCIDSKSNKDKTTASDALRSDYITSSHQSPFSNNNDRPRGNGKADAGKEDPSSYTPIPVSRSQGQLTPNQARIAEEKERFTKLYEQQNITLAPMQEGWGPFQALQQMVKDHKVRMNEDQLLAESRRIRSRDFNDMGRDYYTKTDHPKMWSDKEIAKRVQEAVDRVKGIDVSSYEHTIDWKQVANAGYKFAFMKASEGIDYVDPTFATNRAGALAAGLKVGYYHYFRPNDSVEDQVKNFVKTVGKVDANSIRLVIDAEDPSIWKPYTVPQRVKMIDDWCKEVKNALGVTPEVSVYASPSFVNDTLNNAPELGKYSLWLANYNVAEPHLPKPWTKWDFWQYADNGNVSGITGSVDLDMFRAGH